VLAAGLWWFLRGERVPEGALGGPPAAQPVEPLEPPQEPVSLPAALAEAVRRERADGPVEAQATDPVDVDGTLTLASDGGWPRTVGGAKLFAVGEHVSHELSVEDDGHWSAPLAPGTWAFGAVLGQHQLPVTPTLVRLSPSDLDAGVHLELEPLPAVCGRLVDCSGVALAGIDVVLRPGRATGSTDAEGVFVLPGREGESYRVDVADESQLDGLAPPWWQDARSVGRVEEMEAAVGGEVREIVLGAKTLVDGLVLNPDGEPWAEIHLSLRSQPTSGSFGPVHVVQTDVAGRFERQLPHGDYVALVFPGEAYGGARPDPVPFSLDCLGGAAALVLAFDRGLGDTRVEGVAIDSTGRPMQMAFGVWRVVDGLTPENRMLFPVKASGGTGSDGRIGFTGLPPAEYLVVRTESRGPRSDHVYVDRTEPLIVDTRTSELARFEWVVDGYPRTRLSGTVDASYRATSSRLSVALRYLDGEDQVRVEVEQGGDYTFEGLGPGAATVTLEAIRSGDWIPLATRNVSIAAGVEKTLDFMTDSKKEDR
jgi:hypothetical protein